MTNVTRTNSRFNHIIHLTRDRARPLSIKLVLYRNLLRFSISVYTYTLFLAKSHFATWLVCRAITLDSHPRHSRSSKILSFVALRSTDRPFSARPLEIVVSNYDISTRYLYAYIDWLVSPPLSFSLSLSLSLARSLARFRLVRRASRTLDERGVAGPREIGENVGPRRRSIDIPDPLCVLGPISISAVSTW